jgi:phenylalanyl-tRNA synthetase beta subunit
MRFRASDRTLEDQEVNAVMAKIEQRVGTDLGARIRGR